MKKQQYYPAIPWTERSVATDHLVVIDPAVSETHCSISIHLHAFAPGQAWSQDHCIEKVTVAANIGVDGSVVKGARKGRDEVYAPSRSALQETPAWDLDSNFYTWLLTVYGSDLCPPGTPTILHSILAVNHTP